MPTLTGRCRPLVAVVLILMATACPGSTIAEDAAPTIRIVEPRDGAVVRSPLTVQVEVSNFVLQPPGSGKKPNAGHIHYWIDDRTNAMIYPATPKTTVRLLVDPGRHKIRAEIVQDDHTSLAEGRRDATVRALPADPAFERRSTMATVSVEVR